VTSSARVWVGFALTTNFNVWLYNYIINDSTGSAFASREDIGASIMGGVK